MIKTMRIAAALLSVAVVTASFAGCSGSKKENAASKSTESTLPEKTIEISWVPQNDAPVDPESPIVKELEKKFNVKLNFIYLERSKEAELLNMQIASGEIPDVMKLSDERMRTYGNQNVLAEIPENILKSSAPGLYDLVKKNGGDVAWEFGKEKGKLYGIPMLSPDGNYQYVPIWRDDWLANVGITKIPETLKEAEEAFIKFVNNDPDKNGKKDTYALSDKGMSAIFGAYGAIPYLSKGGGDKFTWSVKNGKVVVTAILPEMKQALELLSKWYKDGLIDPEFISGENKGQYWGNAVTFWNGKIGFSCPGQSYHVSKPLSDKDGGSQNYKNFIQLQAKGSYDFGKPLAGPSGKGVTEKWGTVTGVYIVLGKKNMNEAKMKKILEISEAVSTDFETFVFHRYGQAGIHHDVIDGEYTYKAEYASSVNSSKAGLGGGGVGYAATNNFEFYKKAIPKRYAFSDKAGNYGTGFSNIVWGGLPSDSQYKDAIDKKIKENYMLFISGARNLNEFDKFVDELNKTGLEQMTKEANEWYKTFYKK